MSITVPEKMRSAVLTFARAITTDHRNAAAVIENTGPLLAYLEAAEDDADLEQRYNALRRQNSARGVMPDDDPDKFVRAAQRYHAYMTGGAR